MGHRGQVFHLLIILGSLTSGILGNKPPYFLADLNNHVIAENTPVGTQVYTLKAVDPENSPLKFGLMGTDKLAVNEKTGEVTVVKPIDRESASQFKLKVTVEDVVGGSGENNLVVVAVVVTVLDMNDNPPLFFNQSALESVEISEEARVGSKVLSISVTDPDITGLSLSLNCTPTFQSPEACDVFTLDVKETTAGRLRADIKLATKLDFNKRSLYSFVLASTDGDHITRATVNVRVKDVQNAPPIFTGSMSGRVGEDAPVGSLVMIVQARDGDLGNPRHVKLTLVSNPGNCFQLDSKTGHLTTTRPLDRETLGSVLRLQVKAEEVIPKDDAVGRTDEDAAADPTETTTTITILIDDVNDYAPRFSRKEMWTDVDENSPVGTPLHDLEFEVVDLDSGVFADFDLRIDGPLAQFFDIEPKVASGSARPVIRINKVFDFENPNERKFILLVVAQNIVDPQLVSTATITVVVNDLNDNAPEFEKTVYTIRIPESAPPGSHIGAIVANDPDSKEFGSAGIVYQLVGSGNKKFSVNPKTGDIFIAECNQSAVAVPAAGTSGSSSITTSTCLDYETQKSYDLLYMASDNYKQDGFIHSIVPLQILLTDSNDWKPSFEGIEFRRVLQENARQFEPKFFVRAKDVDATAVLAYRLMEPAPSHFKIDPNSGEILIKSPTLPPGNYAFRVEASDGLYKTNTLVTVNVTDLNNNRPVFDISDEDGEVLNVREDTAVGAVVTKVNASDPDLGDNGRVTYGFEKGTHGYFSIDPETGEVKLIKVLNADVMQKFEIVVTAMDHGAPPLRTSKLVKVGVEKVYKTLPKLLPRIQRAQVSESAKVGDVVLKIATSGGQIDRANLVFQFVQPVEARNVDNKPVRDLTLFPDWFHLTPNGEVVVKNEIERDIVVSLNYTVMVTSEQSWPEAREFGTIVLTFFEVNDLPPRVEDMEIETDEELPPGMSILTLEAEDPEGGVISNYFVQDGAEYISIDNKTGEIKVAGRLDFEERPVYNFTIVVVDSGVPQLSSTAQIAVHLLNINDNTPQFNQSVYDAAIDEHSPEGTYVTTVNATDADGDLISFEITEGPWARAFKIDRVGRIFVSKEGPVLLDREKLDQTDGFIRLGVGARDTNRIGYATVKILVRDVNDVEPTMEQKSYHMTVYAPLTAAQQLLRVSADGGDCQGTDHLTYSILSGNEENVLSIDASSGVISASRAFDRAQDLRVVIEVTDSVTNETQGHYDRSGVLIQVLPGNFRRPEFVFPNKVNWTLMTPESNAAEVEQFESGGHSKLIGQLLAFDSDEGEAGKISYYFKEGDNLVTETGKFRVETDTGKIFQIAPLDREQMNAYNLLAVAKDGGKPVTGMSQHVLNIQVEDIDDHGPRFLTKRYNFSIKENSLENSFVGQVEALDEDEGANAQVFYFLASDGDANMYANEDVRVDIKTGRLYAQGVLDRERLPVYTLYVRASSSPIFNRTAQMVTKEAAEADESVAIVTVKVLDENDNPVRFLKKQYYAAICSEAEPGREILTVQTEDLDDLSSGANVQYSLLGSNLILDEFKSGGSVVPSPFRVDEGTGRLTISSVTMRQYSGGNNRFVVKVGARELVAPYYEDTTLVHIWVVENSQQVILTVKSPPEEMLRAQLIDDLSNITNALVLISKIAPHVSEDGSVNAQWSDVFVSAVDKKSSAVIPVGQFLQALDLGHDRLRQSDCPVELYSAVPAVGTADPESEYFFNTRDSFDTAFAGLVALVALLCMGLAAILALCCCLNRYYSRSSRSSETEKLGTLKYPLHPAAGGDSGPGTPALGRHVMSQPPDMLEDLATDNPLWIDHKLKTYEEQELTMQVASELDTSNGTEENRSVNEEHERGVGGNNRTRHDVNHQQQQSSPQFSHAYATLHPQPHARPSYDQLNILGGGDTLAVHL